jgi:glutamate--cysteine ligase
MLEGLRDRFGWKPVLEGDNIIGLKKDGANVSLEPGGQLELSGAPLETIHQTCDEVNEHLREVKEWPTRSAPASSASAPRRTGRMTTCR